MLNSYKYILEPYHGMSTRFHCPKCADRTKTFCRYIDTETNQYISPLVGRCNKENSCGYYYTPKQYFTNNKIDFSYNPTTKNYLTKNSIVAPEKTSFIENSIFQKSLAQYEKNYFIKYLVKLFGSKITNELISKYYIGTSKKWDGSTVFWQIDTNYKIHTGKVMLYNPDTGKRVKKPFNHINWVHKLLSTVDFNLAQCLFGEHLIQKNDNPIAIVESEKTAIIASVYIPKFTWIACGSLSNLNYEKLKVLKNRKVVLFPDLNGFEKWKTKAFEMNHLIKITVSDLLESKTTEIEKAEGYDIADYLIQHNYADFIK